MAADLEVNEHRGFQRVFWIVQRIAWGCFGLIVIAALAGATGSGGPLHMRRIALDTGSLEVPRISRWEAADEMRLQFSGPGQEHELWLEDRFFERFQIEGMSPAPRSERLAEGGHLLIFESTPPGAAVQVHIRAMHFGRTGFRFAIDGAVAETTTFVLP